MKGLYPHQKKFLQSLDNDNALLCYETGTGKTFTADLWLEQKGRSRNAVVICPKQIRQKWKDMVPTATVYSFEDFLKATPPVNPSAVVVDEADAMASPLFIASKRSNRTGKLYEYTQTNPRAHVLLLTATPVRSSPANLHTLLVLCRQFPATKEHWLRYQQAFYELQYKPYLPRPAWFPKKGWQTRMQELINKYTHVALMADVVDLPPERHEVIKLPDPEKYEDSEDWTASATFVAHHLQEQQGKATTIKELSKGYRKVVVVAYYRQQIQELFADLSKERTTFVLDGRTTDANGVIADAEACSECYFIIQSSIGAGFELPSFAVMIFASQGYSVRDVIQMRGRIKRINALKPTLFYYLQAGKCDRMIYKNIEAGKDFIPSEYLS